MTRVLVILLLSAAACSRAPDPPPSSSSSSSPSSSPTPLPSAQRIEDEYEDEDEDGDGDGGKDGGVLREMVTIKLIADARRQARVSWGRQDLGTAPLDIVRPRGSAPLDLLIVAPGYLPLHTRVFTDRNDTLSLRLYSEREAAALPGYAANHDAPQSPATKARH